ncbi:ribose-phosphate diphosphokinase [Parvibaculum sp.]|jgi:ribose-phosphate pyrophosphokinase|uniref:ribose-phosphate diphosphokinase n=1 Tax=Parvibaculum sp. TaxID=2024848 RepID=UPI000C495729|nr:ribose-phosphate diphosphokinase [Parvibaculum sp.]MAM94612.1 phosphoribosylpyrophosphate synthetase [Parvibaculum sp.]|tara:strand:+ start:414 stop:1310 length:897 start_codon:yes stop_codon:yes gene_type:complete
MTSVALYSFAHGAAGAAELGLALGLDVRQIDIHTFPDGESLVRVPSVTETAIVYCPLDRPNEKLVALMLAADAFRRGGARRLVLVAPYLCYMRQDKAFHAGEAVSQQAVSRFLSACFDRVVTVDAHLHRVSSIGEVFPEIEADNLLAAKAIAHFAAAQGHGRETIVLGPDEESIQWVCQLADELGASYMVGHKIRRGDRDVEIEFPDDPEVAGNPVLVVDDIVSSGGTILSAVAAMRKRGAASIHVAITHALFDKAVEEKILSAGAKAVWSTTSVPHGTNAISLAGILADILRRELNE